MRLVGRPIPDFQNSDLLVFSASTIRKVWNSSIRGHKGLRDLGIPEFGNPVVEDFVIEESVFFFKVLICGNSLF